jgi:hypothetical protein
MRKAALETWAQKQAAKNSQVIQEAAAAGRALAGDDDLADEIEDDDGETTVKSKPLIGTGQEDAISVDNDEEFDGIDKKAQSSSPSDSESKPKRAGNKALLT